MASAGHFEKVDGKTVFVRNNNGKTQKNVRMGPNNTNQTVQLGQYIKPAPAAPAPKPAAPKHNVKVQAKPAIKPKESIKYSPEIKQAKERVSSYENDILSGKTSEDIHGQSSFIKPMSSDSNYQINFSSDTFEANQSSKSNKQAQAAQNQMQNYISKYKSSDRL